MKTFDSEHAQPRPDRPGRMNEVMMDLPKPFTFVRSSAYRGYLAMEYIVARGESYNPLKDITPFLAEVRAALAQTKQGPRFVPGGTGTLQSGRSCGN